VFNTEHGLNSGIYGTFLFVPFSLSVQLGICCNMSAMSHESAPAVLRVSFDVLQTGQIAVERPRFFFLWHGRSALSVETFLPS